MQTFYVSLTQDLINCYLVASADSETAVRCYLSNKYRTSENEWKLPWCSVYTEAPTDKYGPVTLIHPHGMQRILEEDEQREFDALERDRRLSRRLRTE